MYGKNVSRLAHQYIMIDSARSPHARPPAPTPTQHSQVDEDGEREHEEGQGEALDGAVHLLHRRLRLL